MQTLLYKSIDEDLLNSFTIEVQNREFFYKNNTEKFQLDDVEYEDFSFPRHFSLEDPAEKWNYKENPCYLNLTLRCKNLSCLFGTVCNSDARLGLGLVWKTNNSKIKNCIKLGEFTSEQNEEVIFDVKDIRIPDLSASIDFYWTIYLIDFGQNKYSLPSYAKHPGMILGKDIIFTFVVDTSNKIFPIIPKADPTGPLWGIYFNVTDPLIDSFTADNLYIYYNTDHPSYKKYLNKGKDFCEPFFKEFLESSVYALLLDLKQLYDYNDTLSFDAETENDGSVQQTVNYLQSLGVCFNKSNEDLHRSIQLLLQKEKHLCD